MVPTHGIWSLTYFQRKQITWVHVTPPNCDAAGLDRSNSGINRRPVDTAGGSRVRRMSSLAGGSSVSRHSPSSPSAQSTGQGGGTPKRPGVAMPQEWDKSINQGALQLAALQQAAARGYVGMCRWALDGRCVAGALDGRCVCAEGR
jgi:hypothetical protein